MSNYIEIEGDLIDLAKRGNFDVIAHGCNCFSRMKRGIAPQMAAAFRCDRYRLEDQKHAGDIRKLGQIETMSSGSFGSEHYEKTFSVVNAYTQYHWDSKGKPLDYEAFTLCMRKINHIFHGEHIGLPQIGAGLAGGDWQRIKKIIQTELKDMNVTVVIYKK